jgi:hypothetical protein
MEYQSYLKDCDCYTGIILIDNKAVCRWCRKPYAKGGKMFYEPGHVEVKKPLFTTEDGVDVYEGTRVWYVNDNYTFNFFDFRQSDRIYIDICKYFSTEEKAKEHILHNKPVEVSFSEIDNYLKVLYGDAYYPTSALRQFFEEKIKSKKC